LHSDPRLLERAIDLAAQYRLPAAYDAHYLAVAEALGAPFWTTDQRLFNSVQTGLSWVHLVVT
jgi:predicted nucleic acid-binding protein